METLLAHVQERWMAYAALLVCCLPLLLMFRKQVFPILSYVIEICFYLASFHLVLNGLVRLVRWFKIESTTYVREKIDPGWTVPLFEFWDRERYKPIGLFYFEAAIMVLILYLVWRFRPYKSQKLVSRVPVPPKGMAASVRPPGHKRSGVYR